MAFYSDFAGHYETVFPYREAVFACLDRWLPRAGRVLDVGCGTGRYCDALNRAGRQCLGIDLDPGMISEAERLHPDGDFQILGMEDIHLLPSGGFTGIVCVGNVLPHLPAGRLAAFLMDVKNLLAPGGVWIFQTVNFDPLLKLDEFVFPELHFPEADLTFMRWYEDIRLDRLGFHTSLLGPDGEIFAGEVVLYPRTSVDYLLGHRNAGFSKLGHFSDFGGRGFNPTESSGSVFVFRRDP
jgi:SAM-dependent methyltransferase